jgi:hypothetical protein
MPFSQTLDRKIGSIGDLAKAVGVKTQRGNDELLDTFLRNTNYDVAASIDVKEVTFSYVEKWQIEVSKTRSKPIIRVRSGNRGKWIDGSADVPVEVLSVLSLCGQTCKQMKTSRCFSSWQDGNWSPFPCRRLRSGANTLSFCITVPEVQRATGHQICNLILSPFGREEDQVIAELEMPFRLSDLAAAIESIKARYTVPPAAA